MEVGLGEEKQAFCLRTYSIFFTCSLNTNSMCRRLQFVAINMAAGCTVSCYRRDILFSPERTASLAVN